MNTIVFHPESDPAAIQEAAAILRRGGLVGIPTETVYGLGADALNEEAVVQIFLAKGRPQDNPLIIHVPDASWLEQYCRDVIQLTLCDLDIIAEHAVIAHAQVPDAGLFLFAGLDLREHPLTAGLDGAQLVEFFVRAVADQAALAQQKRRIVHDGRVDLLLAKQPGLS